MSSAEDVARSLDSAHDKIAKAPLGALQEAMGKIGTVEPMLDAANAMLRQLVGLDSAVDDALSAATTTHEGFMGAHNTLTSALRGADNEPARGVLTTTGALKHRSGDALDVLGAVLPVELRNAGVALANAVTYFTNAVTVVRNVQQNVKLQKEQRQTALEEMGRYRAIVTGRPGPINE